LGPGAGGAQLRVLGEDAKRKIDNASKQSGNESVKNRLGD
jgi:hypothetical protein